MKKLFLIMSPILALSAMATTTFAADQSVAPGWDGFYLGGNIGYGHETWGFHYYDNQIPAGGTKTVSDGNLIGGLQAGYNWQTESIVYGLEADLQASSLKSDQQGGFNFDSCGCFNVAMGSFGTVRARVGALISPDVLIYGTGGLIVGDLSYSAADSNPIGADRHLALGWTAGGGAEFKVSENTSVKLEGLYYNFGSPYFNLADTNFNTNLDVNGYIARVGFNVHF